MSFAGEDFKLLACDAKDETVGLVDANTPPSAEVVAQGLGVADARRTIAIDALKQLVDAFKRFGILLLPKKVFRPGAFMPNLTHGGVPRY